ncbi:CRAL-TRIO domain [Macleaya cordata]|uniref:CRAL-TRIO domain n=1 Tax=Macleaya cordata TaxID=56857 RepID=A0A200Q099_MACCD|nr:CRAL-TRIO domain [Macleaya cordata]
MSSKKFRASVVEKPLSIEEQQAKINEVRKLISPTADKLPALFSDASISRYLRARNWNTKKACKMLKETFKWRMEYKPEKICWDDIAREAETGKIYRSNYLDNYGRTVLVMRPGLQNSNSTTGQIKYLVYCMENAVMNLPPGQEQMVWLIDFQGWNKSSISVKVTRETAHILQNHYPERLGRAIFYNPPKIFESFWSMVKPFLESKTSKKVKFVYSDDPESQKVMGELFDMEKLESAFGGRNPKGFDYKEYSERMREDDKKMSDFINSGYSTTPSHQPSTSDHASEEPSDATSSSSPSSPYSSSSDKECYPKLEGTEDYTLDEKIQDQIRCKDSEKDVTEAHETDVTQMSH